jgi:hypothetical protein
VKQKITKLHNMTITPSTRRVEGEGETRSGSAPVSLDLIRVGFMV